MHGLALEELRATDAGWTGRARIAADSRWFDGHFPGDPILPGVAELSLVTELARRCLGPDQRITGLANVRFRLTVRPRDVLDLNLGKPGPDGSAIFRIQRGAQTVVSGRLTLAGEASRSA